MVSQKGDRCPCDSGQQYKSCCGPFLSGASLPATAEALMRSRYSAYVEENHAYLRETWHSDYRPASVAAIPGQKWLGLKIKHTEAGSSDDEVGVVEFVARFKVDGKGHRLHEVSRFVKQAGRWLYTEGDLQGEPR